MRQACDHPVGLGKIQAERLFHDNVFAGRRGVERDLAMAMIRRADQDHVQFGHRKHLPVIGEVMWNVVFRGEVAGIAQRWRGDREHLRDGAMLQRGGMDVGNELRTNEAGFDFFIHELFRGSLRSDSRSRRARRTSATGSGLTQGVS